MLDNQESLSKELDPQYEVYNDVYLYKGDELICSNIFNIEELKKMVELANNAKQLMATQQALDSAVEALKKAKDKAWKGSEALANKDMEVGKSGLMLLRIYQDIEAALASIKE